MSGWIPGVLVLALLLAGLSVHVGWIRIPPNWAPWGKVELERPPGWFARYQINGLSVDPAACHSALNRSKLRYLSLPDRPMQNGCGLSAGVRMSRSHVQYSSGFQATCSMAAGLYWYESAVDAAARRYLGSGIVRIDHLGSYACRDVVGQGFRSQHATANALDISGFRLENGDSVSVRDDWGKATAKGRFLATTHDDACRFFNTVLGPDYNTAHANHFHLDLGPARICR